MKTVYAVAVIGALLLSTAFIGGQVTEKREHQAKDLGQQRPVTYNKYIITTEYPLAMSSTWVIGLPTTKALVYLQLNHKSDREDLMYGQVKYEGESKAYLLFARSLNSTAGNLWEADIAISEPGKYTESAEAGTWSLGDNSWSSAYDAIMMSSTDGGETLTGWFRIKHNLDFGQFTAKRIKN